MRKGTKVTARDPDGNVIQRGTLVRRFTFKGREFISVKDNAGGVLTWSPSQVEPGHAPLTI